MSKISELWAISGYTNVWVYNRNGDRIITREKVSRIKHIRRFFKLVINRTKIKLRRDY